MVLIDATFLGLGGSPSTDQKTLGSEQAVMRGHRLQQRWHVATSGSCDRTEKKRCTPNYFRGRKVFLHSPATEVTAKPVCSSRMCSLSVLDVQNAAVAPHGYATSGSASRYSSLERSTARARPISFRATATIAFFPPARAASCE